MANWYGAARTNYVRIQDPQGLRRALEDFDIRIESHPSSDQHFMFAGSGEDGSFPSATLDDDGNEVEFSFETHVVPYLAQGQVLLVQVTGNEKLRYLTGFASAYAWDGRVRHINIDDIRDLAAKEFNTPLQRIAPPSYQYLAADDVQQVAGEEAAEQGPALALDKHLLQRPRG